MELRKVNSVSQQHVVEVKVNSIGELKQAVANFMYSEDMEIVSTKKTCSFVKELLCLTSYVWRQIDENLLELGLDPECNNINENIVATMSLTAVPHGVRMEVLVKWEHVNKEDHTKRTPNWMAVGSNAFAAIESDGIDDSPFIINIPLLSSIKSNDKFRTESVQFVVTPVKQ